MIKKHQDIINNYKQNLKILNRFEGGMSNFTYKVEDINTKEIYVARIKGDHGELFVNHFEEEENLKLVDSLNINSETIITDPKSGFKLGRYIKGHTLSEDIDYQKAADTLKVLHSANFKFNNDYNPLDKLTKFEQTHKENKQEYLILKDKFISVYNQYLVNNKLLPCHNDSQIANFISGDDNKYYLLDWEFSANNDLYYDIASFGNKEFSDAINLLNTYFDNPSDKQYLYVYAWRMFQCLQWHNVAQAKHELGMSEKLNVPFDKVAIMYLTKADDLYKEIETKYL